ncbi:MAG: glycosyltransferase [Kiritimatiellaceae bacterium]|nr:glycosyltransferase [Kiritimatiellaceae bacterium]
MKILFLTNKLPHAEVAGGHRIIYQRIRYLAEQGHQIGLLTFIQNETTEQIHSLEPLLKELHTLQHPHRNILIRAFHDYLSLSRPAVFWKSYSKKMMEAVGEVSEHGKYDIIIAEFSEMGQYLHKNPYLSAVHKVISCHRCVAASYEKYSSLGEINLKLYLKSLPQLRGLQKYEFNMYRCADRILVLTPQDRFTMQYYAQDLGVSIASAGVDMQYLRALPPVPKEPIVLLTGFMSDPANEDSVLWFYHHVWPKLSARHPDVKFYIVGAGAGPRIRKLAEKDKQIVVTGQVDDLRPYRNRASVFVSPVRLGSGMRTKVLEAMAGGLPVVSTSLGMAGIDAQTGVNCLVADTAELFTQSVEWLLTDRALAERMAVSAGELVEKKHSLEDGLQRFEKILTSIVER